MADKVNKQKRSIIMSKIRGKDTKPEMFVRRLLHSKGFRYRLHDRSLPGSPDIVFRKKKAVIEVNGCFWHGHDCGLSRIPKTRVRFWRLKLKKNVERDKRNIISLRKMGWRVCTIWECSITGKHRLNEKLLSKKLINWLDGNRGRLDIALTLPIKSRRDKNMSKKDGL